MVTLSMFFKKLLPNCNEETYYTHSERLTHKSNKCQQMQVSMGSKVSQDLDPMGEEPLTSLREQSGKHNPYFIKTLNLYAYETNKFPIEKGKKRGLFSTAKFHLRISFYFLSFL
ncbi:LOW QUALITY PROTEIN: hypothetical protein TorRG33x02_116400 [Trema orientale]|uniref:Uncharacterized protein n=1 Tax=Trema orientale TaxID=63057 RepID=A0A2P5F433_TREOI|nr:LOW QUALITY PROTEIN: hypothetical protein TorRG33x02_116400 [Trema orientale]